MDEIDLSKPKYRMEIKNNLSVADFAEICRTCLSKHPEIYEFDWLSTSGWISWPLNSPSLGDLLKKLVFEDESDFQNIFPSKMCLQCCQQFYTINLFLQECKISQDTLKKIVNKSKNLIDGDSQFENNQNINQEMPNNDISRLDEETSLESHPQLDNPLDNLVSLQNDESAAEIVFEEQDVSEFDQVDNSYPNTQLQESSTHAYKMGSDLDIVEFNQDNLEEIQDIEKITENHVMANTELEEYENGVTHENLNFNNSKELTKQEMNGDQFINSEYSEADHFDQLVNQNISENIPETGTVKNEQEIKVDEYQDIPNIKDFEGNVIIYEKPNSDSEESQCTNYESLAEENDSAQNQENFCENQPENLISDFLTILPEIEGLGYMCSTCDSPFISYRDLMEHKTKLGHNLEQIFVCPECEKKFYRYSMFHEHFQSHMLCDSISNDENEEQDENSELVDMDLKLKYAKPYTCKTCNLGLISEEKLIVHTLRYHSSMTCKTCGVTLSTSNLEDHKIVCGKKDSPPTFPCKKCSEKFEDEKLLYEHITKSHGSQIFAKCETCGMLCMGKKHLEKHMRKFHKDKECPKCSQIFQQSKELTAHLATVHKKSSICEHCGKKFTWRASMMQHVKTHHTGTPTFRCNLCGKNFLNRKLFTYHVYRHEGKKPFSCVHCGTCFNNKDNLITHLKTHSEQEGISRCVTCDKRYFLKDNLRRHLINEHGYEASSLKF